MDSLVLICCRKRTRRLDWMYEAPGMAGPSAEEYLKGKVYKPVDEKNDVDKVCSCS